jgi:hypothetical protein
MEILFLYGASFSFCQSISLSPSPQAQPGVEIANATPCRLANCHKDYFRLGDNSTKSTWMQAAFSERKDFETQTSTLNTELSVCNGRRGLTSHNRQQQDPRPRDSARQRPQSEGMRVYLILPRVLIAV